MFIAEIFDPVLRGPLFACTLMGILSAIIGLLVVFQAQSLKGEVLSHACYPGMVVGSIVASLLGQDHSMFFVCIGALATAYIGALGIDVLVHRWRVSSDSALSFVLSFSFSLGLLLISAIQRSYPTLWRRLQALLVGQAATMGDRYVVISFVLLCIVLLVAVVFRRQIIADLFDKNFSQVQRLSTPFLKGVCMVLLVITIIVSIRSMGVVLMSSMLLFPAVTARLLTDNFKTLSGIAATIGGGGGAIGVLFSHFVTFSSGEMGGRALWLPTGPIICLTFSLLFAIALLLSPKEGLITRIVRRIRFVRRCFHENLLKILWKECAEFGKVTAVSQDRVMELFPVPSFRLRRAIRFLTRREILVVHHDGRLELTALGLFKGRRLVRLHRLWELYLVEYCHMPKERVHPSAEEMEHILTPHIERTLTELLHNPRMDPHDKPIPMAEEDF